MNKALSIILLLLTCTFLGVHAQNHPLINELVTANISGIPDEYDIIPDNCPVPDCEQWYNDLGRSVYDGNYPGWVEIYNPTNTGISMADYCLSDDPYSLLKWIFPQITLPAKSHMLVFLSGKDRKVNAPPDQYLHTNFKLDRKAESLYLSSIEGNIIGELDASDLPLDFSLGRMTDGADQWLTFISPTPMAANTGAYFLGYSDQVLPVQDPGLYNAALSVTLSQQVSGAEIRYTTNGNDPGLGNKLYSGPISISNTTVIKARVFKHGKFISPVFTGTYVINDHDLPVVCLTTPQANLWDGETGIYTPGNNADEVNRIANYWNNWERPAHIELFEPDGSASFSIDAGIKIFGWGSRTNDRRSMAVMIRDKYGIEELEYPLLPDSDIKTYKSFVLRNGGQDWQETLIRDPLVMELTKDLDIERQLYRFCVVYLNGEYWGIHNIRSKINEDYLASHSWADKDKVDIISRYWRRTYPVVIEGDDEQYMTMENYIRNTDLSNNTAFETVEEMIDVQNIIDYFAVNTFVSNGDWPGNNNKCWRSNDPESRWRWIMYDLDNTFNLNSWSSYSANTLYNATLVGGTNWPNPDHTTLLFRKLLENESFKTGFILKISDLMNTVFQEDNIKSKIDQVSENLFAEIDEHIKLWGSYGNTLTSLGQWGSNILELHDFAYRRPAYVKGQLEAYFHFSGWKTIKVNISNPGAGSVLLNSILINNSGWMGEYPEDLPVTLSAFPAPGYRFESWSGVSSGSDEPGITVNMSDIGTVTLNLLEDEEALNTIVINEICYKLSENVGPGDWVELYNAYGIPIDISGWILRDSKEGNRYKFPSGSVINPGEYVVVCQDTARFHLFIQKNIKFFGSTHFGFNNTGDTVRLFDQHKNLVDIVSYTNTAPWPVWEESIARTIALLSEELDNAEAENWAVSGPQAGTPGAHNASTPIEQLTAVQSGETSVSVYPNPFENELHLSIAASSTQDIRIELFDIYGRVICTIYEGRISQGENRISCDISHLEVGNSKVFIYRISGTDILTSGMVLRR